MIHINKLSDCHLLDYDPELFREVISYLLYCQYELQEYDNEGEDPNFNFMVLSDSDLSTANAILNDLGIPEETVPISIKANGHIITMYRIIYPTEVLFIPAEISDNFYL